MQIGERSFFGRIYGAPICFRFYLTFTTNTFAVYSIITTEDGSTEALLQILYGQYLILGVFGSCMF